MIEERDYALGDMDRRMGNVLRFGTVSAVDYAKALVKVDLGDLVTDWVPWATTSAGQDRVWQPPDVGEQVAMLSPGDPSQGLVIGSIFQDAHPANGNAGKDWRITFKDGTVLEFDRDASALRVNVNAAGSANVTVGGSTLLVNSSKISLSSNGNTLEISAAGVKHNGVNIGSTHTHSGVATGPANTGAPT